MQSFIGRPPSRSINLSVRTFWSSSPKVTQSVLKMNPYEADPERIPPNDRYADVPFYGRYYPTAADFEPDAAHSLSTSPGATAYWSSVLAQCDETNRIYENLDGGRDVFALGRVIVKSRHLHPEQEGRRSTRDYSLADENEVAATAVARQPLGELGIKVPEIYFAGKVCCFHHANQWLRPQPLATYAVLTKLTRPPRLTGIKFLFKNGYQGSVLMLPGNISPKTKRRPSRTRPERCCVACNPFPYLLAKAGRMLSQTLIR